MNIEHNLLHGGQGSNSRRRYLLAGLQDWRWGALLRGDTIFLLLACELPEPGKNPTSTDDVPAQIKARQWVESIVSMAGLPIMKLRDVALFAFFLGHLTVFAESPDFPTGDKAFDAAVWAAYKSAISDSKVRTPERQRTLSVISKANKSLIWRSSPYQDQLLVVSLFEEGFDPAKKIATRDYWVTAAPELRRYHDAHKKEFQRPILRLKQLLGLKPDGHYTHVVEFWVNRHDIFRPSPDREVDDNAANLDFDPHDQSPETKAHREWCEKTQSEVDNRWPWTRLGYSYDWGNLYNHMGLSEFVVRKGAAIEVWKTYPLKDYFSSH